VQDCDSGDNPFVGLLLDSRGASDRAIFVREESGWGCGSGTLVGIGGHSPDESTAHTSASGNSGIGDSSFVWTYFDDTGEEYMSRLSLPSGGAVVSVIQSPSSVWNPGALIDATVGQ